MTTSATQGLKKGRPATWRGERGEAVGATTGWAIERTSETVAISGGLCWIYGKPGIGRGWDEVPENRPIFASLPRQIGAKFLAGYESAGSGLVSRAVLCLNLSAPPAAS